MPDLYIIKDWDDNFETEKTRQYKHCQRVTFENNLNKPKVRRLLRHKDGISHFGVWVAICQFHSTMSKPRTGCLTDTGKSPTDGALPLSLVEISDLIHAPLKTVENAFGRLCDEEIGWIVKLPVMRRPARDRQETVGDTEADHSRYLTPADTIPTDTKPHKVVEIFHEICQGLPKVKKITQTRIRHMKARNREYPDLDWREYFKKVAASDFLMGRFSDSNWSAKFDWLINPANFVKVVEGNYENRASTDPMSVFRD